MIVAAPEILSNDWMIIGRQELTGYGRIDLLAIAPDGNLIVIELKRHRTPREVVAQAIDYASWVETLKSEDIASIYERFAPGRRLQDDFRSRFNAPLDEDTLNQNHQIVIVAESLDESSERIVAYLSERDIPINVMCFQIFNNGNDQFLSRSWLIDPLQTQSNAGAKPEDPREPWNGEFYVNFGGDQVSRSWEDAVTYGFVSAGGGIWYSRTLKLLSAGDRIWVKIPEAGFVGVGRVLGPAEPASTFRITTASGERQALDVLSTGHLHRQYVEDLDMCEYFVPVHWIQTVTRDQAVEEIGLFGNQNTVCKPTTPKWRYTIERLKQHFPKFNEQSTRQRGVNIKGATA